MGAELREQRWTTFFFEDGNLLFQLVTGAMLEARITSSEVQ